MLIRGEGLLEPQLQVPYVQVPYLEPRSPNAAQIKTSTLSLV